ncbi:hypothetical protein CROQUDRAFT_485239 [Cronartium quercuum f. sp. fusiforme G11]|uniref:Tc1-like transposase DDE domain-containing protein n=1 Tax=Cronartium quercuum f. sp. fusiforme G11 TaxID=708437 RepID=A0A9P6TCC4_9BASI|nr:hypothetical protein CROQUDRAFT_485239 [Cronartium quercuum f. sp. fusiforme G11]
MPTYSPDFKLLATRMWIQQVPLQVIHTALQKKISKSSLNTWAQLLRTTGSVTRNKLTYAKQGRRYRFSDEQLAVMKDIVTNDPSIFIDELQLKMENITDPHQSAEDRADYVAKIAGIPPECLVFIDASSIEFKDTFQKHGLAKRGQQTKQEVRSQEGLRWTILPAVAECGMIAAMVFKGSVEHVHVEQFLKRDLLPVMNEYPEPYSVLVMDNAHIHHTDLIEAMCHEAVMKQKIQHEQVWETMIVFFQIQVMQMITIGLI